MTQALQLYIEGRVQGVGYRQWMLSLARQIGICGWVRNIANGQVHALLVGTDVQLAQLVEQCRRGPALAKVLRVNSQVVPVPQIKPTTFQIIDSI